MFILDTGRKKKIHSLGISHDGRTLAVIFHKYVEIWSLVDRNLICQIPKPHCSNPTFSLCGRYLCTTAINLLVFDLEKRDLCQLVPKQFISVQMFSDGKPINIGYGECAGKLIFGVQYLADNNEISIGWSQEIKNYRLNVDCGFSRNGRRIILREWREIGIGSRDVFAIRNTVTGELIQDIPQPDSAVWIRSFELSGDANRIYSIDDKFIYEQNVDTGNIIRQKPNPDGQYFIDLLMHPSWKIMMSVHEGGKSINVWDADTLELKTTYVWPTGNFSCITISPDGLIAAAGNAHGKVVVWDLDDV